MQYFLTNENSKGHTIAFIKAIHLRITLRTSLLFRCSHRKALIGNLQ